MRAFKLFQEILKNGLTNNNVMEYKHNKEIGLEGFFGEYSVTGKIPEDEEEFIAIWSDSFGDAQIDGIADIILSNGKKDKIYLYCIE